MILKPMFPEIKIISYYASELQRIWCAKLIKRCTSEHVTRSIVCNTFISKLFTVITNFRDQKRNKYVGVEVYVNDLSSHAADIFVTFGKFIAKCRNHKTQTETLKKFVYRICEKWKHSINISLRLTKMENGIYGR